jgi:superfamily II DNA or RNA helicase
MESRGGGGLLGDQMGVGKCCGPHTNVLMWAGGYKLAKDVVNGDLLIGDDSTPRTVLSTCTGREQMYKIKQTKGTDYTVNEPHILSLKISGHKESNWYENKKQWQVGWFDRTEMQYRIEKFGMSYRNKEEAFGAMKAFRDTIDDDNILDITVKDYLTLNKETQVVLKGFKVGVDFPEQEVLLDPYVLGAWLSSSQITTNDEDIVSYIRNYCDENEFRLHQNPSDDGTMHYRINDDLKSPENGFTQQLRGLNVLDNKHIPSQYLQNSRDVRLSLLAGVIDADGCQSRNCLEIFQKNERLSEDISYLARSLGFFVSHEAVQRGREGTYYKNVISGAGLEDIPVLLARKKCVAHSQENDVMVTDITIEALGEGDYCGFTIDGNRRFLIEDFTVTHNTFQMLFYMKLYPLEGLPTLIVGPPAVVDVWAEEIRRVQNWPIPGPKARVLVYHGQNRIQELTDEKWDYVVTTYGILTTGELKRHNWGRIILDESHSIRNGIGCKVPKRAKAAFEIAHRAKYRWCLSGTPFNNRMGDVAAQAMFIGTEPYNDKQWWKRNADNEYELRIWAKKCMLRRTKTDIGMEIAPPVFHYISVTPTETEKELIEALRAQAAEEFSRWRYATGIDKSELTMKILGLIQKLRMYSNSFYVKEEIEDIIPDDVYKNCAKVRHIIEDLDKWVFKDEKHGVVVYSEYTSFLRVLKLVIEDHLVGIEVMEFNGTMSMKEKNTVVKRFNEKDYPAILLVSFTSGNSGINLQHGSSTVIMCEPYYSSALETQAEQRVHRHGQTAKQVNIIKYTVENSVELWVNKLKAKKEGSAALLGLSDITPENVPTFAEMGGLFQDYVSFIIPPATPVTRKINHTPLKPVPPELKKRNKMLPRIVVR